MTSHYFDYSRHVVVVVLRAHEHYHEKINSWVFLCFPYVYGAPLSGPSGHRSSAKKLRGENLIIVPLQNELQNEERKGYASASEIPVVDETDSQ